MKGGFISSYQEKNSGPAEKIFDEFLDAGTGREAMEKGIPIISFIYRNGEDMALLKAISLPDADRQLAAEAPEGEEILYRADYLSEGRAKTATGVLPAERKGRAFLERLRDAVKAGNVKAGTASLCRLLEAHLTFCGMEGLAERELSRMDTGRRADTGGGDFLEAGVSYYKEVLHYVEKGRGVLNAGPFPMALLRLPPFPDKGRFMQERCGRKDFK